MPKLQLRVQGGLTTKVVPKRVGCIPSQEVVRATELEDSRLVKRREQDKYRAFWQLWEQNQGYLYKRCLQWMGGNAEDAEEALSCASLKAWEKLSSSAGIIANPKAWLTRLTHNVCMDMHRERSRGIRSLEDIEETALVDRQLIAAGMESPESVILRREVKMYLHRAIDTLPAKLSEPFIMRCYQDMPYRDIAKRLNLSNANVRKRVQQAREILQKRLQKYFLGWDCSQGFAGATSSSDTKSAISAKPDSDEPTTLLDRQVPIAQEYNIYRNTATCLESLPHAWYSLPCLLEWS